MALLHPQVILQVSSWGVGKLNREDLRMFGEGAVALVVVVFAGLPPAVMTLLVLQGMDVLTGLMAGFVTKTLDSKISYEGLMRKALVIVTVAGSSYLGNALQLPSPELLPTAIAGFYSMHEGVSIVENLVKAGVPFPEGVKAAIGKGKVVLNDDGRGS